jgi:hypothetical protein
VSTPATKPVVIKISPMAHFAVGFFALGLLAVVFAAPGWFAPLLVLPIIASAAIVRYRTTADRDVVTARTLVGSTSLSWDDVDGLRFGRGSWALARLRDGSEVRLPAVTFSTLPRLTAVTGGRVPNPYFVKPDTETDPDGD